MDLSHGWEMSCQLSNVTLVKISWMCFYSPVEARMAKPLIALAQCAFSRSGNFLKAIDELPVQVPDAPPDLLFVLGKPP
jgi:hypothetical protein